MQNLEVYQPPRPNFFYPILIFWGGIIFTILAYLFYDSFSSNSNTNLYLLPWCFVTGFAISVPSLYLLYKKQFNPFHPLVFPAWSYFFPAFAVGGIILAFGLSQPYFLVFVQDESYNLPLTFIYISIGYLSLALGFYLPYSNKIGLAISKKLPVWNWSPQNILIPGIILLLLGFFNNFFAFAMGVIGYQQVAEIGTFDGVIFLVTLFWLEASFILWMCIFRSKQFTFLHYVTIGILLASSLIKSAFQGNRGSLFSIFILIALAFVASERKILLKHKVMATGLLFFVIIIGMIYGSTFRSIKSVKDELSVEEYAGIIVQTFEKISEQDTLTVLTEGFGHLGERVEGVSSVAVVVSNYEKLSIYESGYGLDNNIIKDTLTYLIPRVIWTDKPLATDTKNYGDLYFNYSENAFTLTPIGDLLRNFGPWGIPIGMIFLGSLIRIMYSTLIEGQTFSYWRATLYYMILTSISYEGSYGLIIPYVIKVILVSLIGLILIRFMIRKTA